MQLKLFPTLTTVGVQYQSVDYCPLCGSEGMPHARLTRYAYRVGLMRVPLPQGGVRLMCCFNCDLLWKREIPTPISLWTVMRSAPDQRKPGHQPRLPAILDIVRQEGRTDEYVLRQFESELRWSGSPFSTVTAFDLFSHFANAARATRNVLQFVRPDGLLIVETGDWRSVADPGSWYYANQFEHQIFWSEHSIRYIASLAGLHVEKYERVVHRARLGGSIFKRLGQNALRSMGPLADALFGVDARLVPPPHLEDHLHVMLRKPVVEAVEVVSA